MSTNMATFLRCSEAGTGLSVVFLTHTQFEFGRVFGFLAYYNLACRRFSPKRLNGVDFVDIT